MSMCKQKSKFTRIPNWCRKKKKSEIDPERMKLKNDTEERESRSADDDLLPYDLEACQIPEKIAKKCRPPDIRPLKSPNGNNPQMYYDDL